MTGFTIAGLDPAPFLPLYGLGDAALAERGVVRMAVDVRPGYPCRVTLEDAAPGETVLLVNHEHLAVANPYRSRHAIFVCEGADDAARFDNEIPEQLATRLLSLRAFDADDMMVDAEVFQGSELHTQIERMFAAGHVAYIHAHNARRGCFAARIDRS